MSLRVDPAGTHTSPDWVIEEYGEDIDRFLASFGQDQRESPQGSTLTDGLQHTTGIARIQGITDPELLQGYIDRIPEVGPPKAVVAALNERQAELRGEE